MNRSLCCGAESEADLSKKKRKPAWWNGGSADIKHAQVSRVMMQSYAWKSLSAGSQSVYLYLMLQYEGEVVNPSGKITTTVRQAAEGTGRNSKTIVRAFAELERLGFIECVQRGGFPKIPSVYRFSTHWATLSEPEPEVPW